MVAGVDLVVDVELDAVAVAVAGSPSPGSPSPGSPSPGSPSPGSPSPSPSVVSSSFTPVELVPPSSAAQAPRLRPKIQVATPRLNR